MSVSSMGYLTFHFRGVEAPVGIASVQASRERVEAPAGTGVGAISQTM